MGNEDTCFKVMENQQLRVKVWSLTDPGSNYGSTIYQQVTLGKFLCAHSPINKTEDKDRSLAINMVSVK